MAYDLIIIFIRQKAGNRVCLDMVSKVCPMLGGHVGQNLFAKINADLLACGILENRSPHKRAGKRTTLFTDCFEKSGFPLFLSSLDCGNRDLTTAGGTKPAKFGVILGHENFLESGAQALLHSLIGGAQDYIGFLFDRVRILGIIGHGGMIPLKLRTPGNHNRGRTVGCSHNRGKAISIRIINGLFNSPLILELIGDTVAKADRQVWSELFDDIASSGHIGIVVSWKHLVCHCGQNRGHGNTKAFEKKWISRMSGKRPCPWNPLEELFDKLFSRKGFGHISGGHFHAFSNEEST